MELAIKLKTYFAKLWYYVKLYWKEIGFAVAFIYLLFFVKQKTNLIEELLQEREKAHKEHKENIDKLNQQIQNEIATRRKIESDFRILIDRINKQHADEIKRIALVREEEIKELIRRHHNNPTIMAQTINDLFGIPVMTVAPDRQTWEPQ
jgi:hypothetical protein